MWVVLYNWNSRNHRTWSWGTKGESFWDLDSRSAAYVCLYHAMKNLRATHNSDGGSTCRIRPNKPQTRENHNCSPPGCLNLSTCKKTQIRHTACEDWLVEHRILKIFKFKVNLFLGVLCKKLWVYHPCKKVSLISSRFQLCFMFSNESIHCSVKLVLAWRCLPTVKLKVFILTSLLVVSGRNYGNGDISSSIWNVKLKNRHIDWAESIACYR